MKQYLFYLIISLLFIACKGKLDIEKDFFKVETLEKIEFQNSGFSIRIFGSVNKDLKTTGLTTGFNYWTTPPTTQLINTVESSNNDGEFSVLLSSLCPGKYYYQAFTKLEDREILGEIKEFTIGVEVEVRIAEDGISDNTAVLNISISNIDSFETKVDSFGIVISKNKNIDYKTDTSQIIKTNESGLDFRLFPFSFKDLDFNSKYYVTSIYFPKNKDCESRSPVYGQTDSLHIEDGWRLRNYAENSPIILKNRIPFNLSRAISLSDFMNNRGVYGAGCNQYNFCFDESGFKDIYEYKINSDGVPKPELIGTLPEYREGAVAFELNDTIYIGLGRSKILNGKTKIHQDFLYLDPVSKTFKPINALFPGCDRWDAVAFTLNGRAYVGSGKMLIEENSLKYRLLKDFYEYNPETLSWRKIDDSKVFLNGNELMLGRANAMAFTVNGRAFMGLGHISNGVRDIHLADLWELKEVDTSFVWVRIPTDLPKEIQPRSAASSFILNKGGKEYCYFGGGFIENGDDEKSGTAMESHFFNDFWEFDSDTYSFCQIKSPPIETGRAFGISFSINGEKGYFGAGQNHLRYFQDLWEYTPKKEGSSCN